MTYEIDNDGTQYWRNSRGQFHRIDGPAYISTDGVHAWWTNGQRHRIDGPAVIHADVSQHWYVNGRRHRIDGPAVIHADGGQEWVINNMCVTDTIAKWMLEQQVVWPWDSSTQTLFTLTFGA